MKKVLITFFCGLLLGSLCYFLPRKIREKVVSVEIKGSIVNPGIYSLPSGSRIVDLISLSGGFLEDADMSVVNQSKLLVDEMVVMIYSQDELSNNSDSNTKYIDRECVCPSISSSICFDEILTNDESVIKQTKKISLNTASKEELMTIPGIGEVKANDILSYREEHSFKSIDEIMQIKGIGAATFEKIKDYLTL